MEIHEWIGKRKTSYYFDYRDRDGIKRRVTCDNLEEAERSRESIKKRTRRKRKLFSGMAQRWLDFAKATVRLQSWQGYRSIVSNHLDPHFECCNIDTISRAEIKEFLASKLRDGFAPKTVQSLLSCLVSVFDFAIDDEVISTSPAKGVWRRLGLKSIDPQEIKAMTAQELDRFLLAARKTPPGQWHSLLSCWTNRPDVA